jgi:hypothetical protein
MFGQQTTFGGLSVSIDVPPTAVELVVGMPSGLLPLRSNYAIILTFWTIQRLPTHNYFVMGIYYQLLLRNRVVVASVLLYEVGSAHVECANLTYHVLTSIYSRNR